ncbi:MULTISPECIES: DoxX family protein [unclassified Streptomyces]|uniref:DoxX family protein n=1 Tax=unclassified Streptomyces TaxID=2593676 RepID=UPI000DBA079F|nr:MULTISPECIES: DoxX family protein [unclassified Streptomyces]MYU02816.1 DoxX family membrane protein [Streptomyces sp. SID8366]MYU68119.1 DoxX family membrane protein [Streptomyces sp. SID69]RAJ52566.1 putative oxidoreductase [Streptomyces sp. PsTaAH-130]
MPRNHIGPTTATSPSATRQGAGRTGVSAADCGLLLLRLTFGLFLAGHGAQKLFGLFGGPGLTATGKGFESLGYRPGKLFAAIGGLSEFLGGLGLAAGLFVPLAAAAIVGVMINAMVTVSAAHGVWVDKGGVEYNICIAVVALAVAAIGPGRLALDRFFRWGNGGWPQAAFALVLGGLGAALALAL